MRKVISLFLPTWPTDRLRRQSSAAPPLHEPLVTSGHDGNRRIIFAGDIAAQKLGLRPDLVIAQARARVPNLHVIDADPVADSEALERLAQWCLRYSPVVALDAADGLWIDATGATHLFGGDEAMLRDIVDRLDKAGVSARAAMAETPGAAHALARYAASPIFVLQPGQTTTVLGALPIMALRLAPGIIDGLYRLGFDRIGDLEKVPRAPLALRFGSDLGRRLDQAFGRQAEPLTPIVPPDLVRASRSFAEPISAPSSLERAISWLTGALCSALERRGLGARRLDLLFHRVDGVVASIRVGTAKPVRESHRLARLLAGKLETVDPGFGVERMVLTASLAEPLNDRQSASPGIIETEGDISGLIDTLANRLGANRLFRINPVESDVPERSAHRVPPLAPAKGETWPANLPRPARLLAPPEPIETLALLPDYAPVQFVWRHVRRRIARADGPERIFGEWWRNDTEVNAVRDYFQVEDEQGERFWLFRSGDGEDPQTGSMRWYLHGVFA